MKGMIMFPLPLLSGKGYWKIQDVSNRVYITYEPQGVCIVHPVLCDLSAQSALHKLGHSLLLRQD